MRLDNSAESGATAGAGTTVTGGAGANSGGASGTAWTAVTVGTGVTVKFDNAQAAHGGWSYRHATGTTSAQGILFWDSTAVGTPARLWMRFYWRVSSTATARSVARVRSGATQVLRVQMAAGGQIELRNTSNSLVASAPSPITAGVWWRIEVDARPGASVANTIRIYEGDSETLVAEITGTGNFAAATTVNEAAFGNVATAANLPDAWYDDLAVSDTGWIGPALRTGAGAAVSQVDTVSNGAGAKNGPAGAVARQGDVASPGAGAKNTSRPAAAAVWEHSPPGSGVKTCAGVAVAQIDAALPGVPVAVVGPAREVSAAVRGAGTKTRSGPVVSGIDQVFPGAGAKTTAGVAVVQLDAVTGTPGAPPAATTPTVGYVSAGTTSTAVYAATTSAAGRSATTTAGVIVR